MRSLLLSVALLALLFSCSDDTVNEDGPVEFFSISLSPKLDVLNISEEGRTSSTTYTEVFYSIYDTLCENVVSESNMIHSETIPSLVFPNLAAGKYFFNIEVRGSENITYDTAASFILASDTVIEAVLTNKQFRSKFKDTSGFNEAEVDYVRFQLNFSTIYVPNLYKCTDSLIWTAENYDGSVDEITYGPHTSGFRYSYPIDMVSFQVKYYDSNSILLKSHIIPLTRRLEHHHSYTFNVDLATIWTEAANGDRITVDLEEVNWTEETIDVN